MTVLLDTCAAIWLANGDPLAEPAMTEIMLAMLNGDVLVSPVSAWEIGLLSAPKAGRPAVQFWPDPKTWFEALLGQAGVRLTDLTPDIAIDASYFPALQHRDPGDRLLIATARHFKVPLVTRDSRILAYAAQGHVQAIAC